MTLEKLPLCPFVDNSNEQREFVKLSIRGQKIYLFEEVDSNYRNIAIWRWSDYVLMSIVQFEVERLLKLVETFIEHNP